MNKLNNNITKAARYFINENFINESVLPKKNNKNIKYKVLNNTDDCSTIEMDMTARDSEKLFTYENEELVPVKLKTFEDKLILFNKLIAESKNDVINLATMDHINDYIIEVLKVNIVNRFKIINKLILFLDAHDYSLENTGSTFNNLEKILNSDLWHFKPSQNTIDASYNEKNSWNDWVVDYEHMTIEKERPKVESVKHSSSKEDVQIKAILKNPRNKLWTGNTDLTWVTTLNPKTIKGQLTKSINEMEKKLYPLKTKYILNPHKIINVLQSFPMNKPTRKTLKSISPANASNTWKSISSADTKKNTKSSDSATRKKNDVKEFILPICIDYKKSFNDTRATETIGNIQNKNLLLHLHDDAVKNKEHEGYCCYKELYTIDTFDMLLDTKLKQLDNIQTMTKNTLLAEIDEFEKNTWNNLKAPEKNNMLLDSIKGSPIYASSNDSRNFSDLLFNIAFESGKKQQDPPIMKLQELFPFFLDTKIVKETICLCKKYTFLTIYAKNYNTSNCKTKFSKSLRKKLRVYLLKYKFKQYLDKFIEYLQNIIKTDNSSDKGKHKTAKKNTRLENIQIIKDILIHFREYQSKKTILTYNGDDNDIETNITFDELKSFLEATKSETFFKNNEVTTRKSTNEFNTFIKNESLELKKITDADKIFEYFNGISASVPMDIVKNIISFFSSITEEVRNLVGFLENICMPDFMLNDLLPLDIILNEIFDSCLTIFNGIAQYYFEQYQDKNTQIQQVFTLFSELMKSFTPIYNAILISHAVSGLVTAPSIYSLGLASWDVSNMISGFSKLEQQSMTGINIYKIQFIGSLIENFLQSEISTLILSLYSSLDHVDNSINKIISTTLYSAFASLIEAKESYVMRQADATLQSLFLLFSKKYWHDLGSSLNKLNYYYFALHKIYEDIELNKFTNTYLSLTSISVIELNMKINLYKLTIDNDKFNKLIQQGFATTVAAAAGYAISDYLFSNKTMGAFMNQLFEEIAKDKTISGAILDKTNINKIIKHATIVYENLQNDEKNIITKNYYLDTAMSLLKKYSNVVEFTKLTTSDKAKLIFATVNPLHYAFTRKNKTTTPSVQIDNTLLGREEQLDIDSKAPNVFDSLLYLLKQRTPYDADERYYDDDDTKNSTSPSSNKSATRKSSRGGGMYTKKKRIVKKRWCF